MQSSIREQCRLFLFCSHHSVDWLGHLVHSNIESVCWSETNWSTVSYDTENGLLIFLIFGNCHCNVLSLQLKDLGVFVVILILFILAFGVSSYSLIYGVQKFSWHLLRRIINNAYWEMFGELNTLPKYEGKINEHISTSTQHSFFKII